MITFYKDGSGIHIKKSHKGKFTEYCGGKVTEECIRRGKNSPDPKIRKQATFAKNARVFKHQEGDKMGPTVQPTNTYGGKGPVSDSDYITNYNNQIQANQDAFNTQQQNWLKQKTQDQLAQQQKIQQIDNAANVIGDIVKQYVPTQEEIDNKQINQAYDDAGISQYLEEGRKKGLTDQQIFEQIKSINKTGIFANPTFDENGMLQLDNERRMKLAAQQREDFINQINKNFKGGVLKLKTYYYG